MKSNAEVKQTLSLPDTAFYVCCILIGIHKYFISCDSNIH